MLKIFRTCRKALRLTVVGCESVRFVFFSALCLFTLISAGPGGGQASASEKVLVYDDVHAPVRFPFYARPGTVLNVSDVASGDSVSLDDIPACNRPDMTCYTLPPLPDNNPRATIECGVDGKWKVRQSSGSCFLPPFGCCYRNAQGQVYVDHGCRIISVGTDIRISEDTSTLNPLNCRGNDNIGTPAEKNYCVFNYSGQAGVSGDTGDDMFEIDDGAGAFFVYKNVSASAKYIERNGGRAGQKIMMPSGPASTFADYKQFINNPPDFIKVENACPPVEITLCGSLANAMPEPPAVDAVCGRADGNEDGYTGYDAIPPDDLCAFGDPFSVFSDDPERIKWACIRPPELGGGSDAQCSAKKIVCPDGEEAFPDDSGRCGRVLVIGQYHERADATGTSCGAGPGQNWARCGSHTQAEWNNTFTGGRECGQPGTVKLFKRCIEGWNCPEDQNNFGYCDSHAGFSATANIDRVDNPGQRCVPDGRNQSFNCIDSWQP